MVSLPLVHVWNKRHLIFHLAVLNIKIRFKNTYLGLFWAAIEPTLTFILLYVVFTSIRAREADFAIYLITGIIFFHVFTRGTGGGVGSLTTNGSILKSLNIRREIFPVVATVSIGLLAFVDIGVFFGLMPIFEFVPSWTIILLPIPLILLLFLILGVSYFLSIGNVFMRDVQHMWSIISHTLLFISPIFWRLDEVDGILLEIQKVNPVGQLIELAHIIVIEGHIPPLNQWAYTTLFILAIFFSGYFLFKKFEYRVAEEL